MKVMYFDLLEIDRPEWNLSETSNSLASYLIRNPEIISKTAKFQEIELVITTEKKRGGQRRVDLVFEDDDNIYFVECENKITKDESEQIEGIKTKLEECKKIFLEYYKGNKKIEFIMAIINNKKRRFK